MKKTANNGADQTASNKRPMLKIAMVATLLLSASLASAYWLFAPDGTKAVAATGNPVQPVDERASALRTGVIIFQRLDGTDCGRKVIDNATGRLHGAAEADCRHQTALIGRSKPKYDPGARLDAVRSSFNPNKPAM